MISRIDEQLVFEAYEMACMSHNSSLKETCLQILINHNFKLILHQKQSVNKMSESCLFSILQDHFELKKQGREGDSSRFLSTKEIGSVVKDYYQANCKDEKLCKNKISSYLHTFSMADPNEPSDSFEAFTNDEYYHDPKFFTTHLKHFQVQMMKIEKQNHSLSNDVKELRAQVGEISSENQLLRQKIDCLNTLAQQNEGMKLKIDTVDIKVSTLTTQITEKVASIQQKLSNQISNQATNTENKLTQQTSEIQKQLVSQSNNFKEISLAISKLQAVIIEKSNSMPERSQQQQHPIQQSLLQALHPNQPIVTDGLIVNGNSSLILVSHMSSLKQWIPKQQNSVVVGKTCRLELLYKASVDGFGASSFHTQCDNKKPTISFIKSQGHGRIFGGYTEQTWNAVAGRIRDSNSFLFSLTHNEKYPAVQSSSGIYCANSFSLWFGDGNDIVIWSGSNNVESSYCNFPSSYQCLKFRQITEESKSYLAGSYHFKVEEIEVYHVTWI